METGASVPGDGSSDIVFEAIRDGVLKMEGDMNTFVCQLCKINMTGIIPAEFHLRGSKHKKIEQISNRDAALEQRHDNPDSPLSNVLQAAIKSGLVTFSHLGNQMVFTCVPCNKPCSGDVPMKQHLKGEPHAKKLRQKTLSSSLSHEKSPIAATNTIHYDSASPTNISLIMQTNCRKPPDFTSKSQDVQDALRTGLVSSSQLGNQVVLTCGPCNKSCTGEVPMVQHLSSETHLKKIRLSKLTSKESPVHSSAKQPIERSPVSSTDHTTARQHSLSPHKDAMAHKDFPSSISSASERSPVSSSDHTTARQHSPSPHKDAMAHKDFPSSISSASGSKKVFVVDEAVVKKEDGYECAVCEVTCNSRAQITSHLQGEPHKKQYRLMQSAHMLVGASESQVKNPIFSRPSTTKDSDVTHILSPLTKFKVVPRCSSAARAMMKHEESGGSFMEEINNSSIRISDENQVLNDVMKLLPDVRIYTAKEALTDLFEE